MTHADDPFESFVPSPSSSRSRRRAQLLRSLFTGAVIQCLGTAVALLVLHHGWGHLHRLPGNQQLPAAAVVFLLPAGVGGAAAGYLALRVRWWQLATLGVLASVVFLILAAFSRDGGIAPILRYYLAATLVIVPIVAGMAAHLAREHFDQTDPALEPRPWGE